MYSDRYSELYHYGIKGQSWGKRRWQNTDGSLTPEGYVHYGYKYGKKYNKAMNAIDLANARLTANKDYYNGTRKFYLIANKKRTQKKKLRDDKHAAKVRAAYRKKAEAISKEVKDKYGIDLEKTIRKTISQNHVTYTRYYGPYTSQSLTYTNIYSKGKRYVDDIFSDKQKRKLMYSTSIISELRTGAQMWQMYYDNSDSDKKGK